jgi:hypothetical protein
VSAVRKSVDAREAVRLHRQGWKVTEIAQHFSVQRPAIYRAFHSENYLIGTMRPREAEVCSLMPRSPQPRQNPASVPRKVLEELEVLLRPRVNRDPCPRCGVRRDVGCKHAGKPALGWYASLI